MVVGFLMVEGLLVCYCTENGINQYAGQKTLIDVFGPSFSLLEQYIKKSTFLNIKYKRRQPIFSFPP